MTNTNWQSYSGEATIGHLVQMAGLAVQNFVSAAVGIAVAVALVRGFARRGTDRLGNFWVDLVRICLRVLLPLSVVAALVLLAGGVVQNLSGGTDVTTLAGATQHVTGGPVATQEAIKELGTNGGGFYNANSAHPFENPTAWTNWLEIFLLLLIPFALPRMFGRMVGDRRQGYAIAGVMAGLGRRQRLGRRRPPSSPHREPSRRPSAQRRRARRPASASAGSALFAAATTLTSTGAVDSLPLQLHRARRRCDPPRHDARRGRARRRRLRALRDARARHRRRLRRRAHGRPDAGVPGQEDRRRARCKLASLYFLTTPALVLVGTGRRDGLSAGAQSSMLNAGPHGLSEVLYAYTSAGNNNGSAFAGPVSANTPWYNTALGLAMLLGRFLPIVLVLGARRARSPARAPSRPRAGTLPTHRRCSPGCSPASSSSSSPSPTCRRSRSARSQKALS